MSLRAGLPGNDGFKTKADAVRSLNLYAINWRKVKCRRVYRLKKMKRLKVKF